MARQAYRREEIKAGTVILVSLAVLAGLIVLVSRGGFRSTPQEYRIEFGSVGGLEEGAQVRFGGVRVGRVLKVTPPGKDSSKVQVVIGLRQDVALRNGTEAVISTLGLVGEHYIELSNLNPAPGEIPPGGLIASRSQPSLGELLEEVRDLGGAAKGLLGRVQAVVDGPVQDVLRRTSQAVNTGDRALKSMDQMLGAENRENIRKSLAHIAAILDENRGPIRSAAADLGTLIRRMDGLVTESGGFVRRLDAAVADGGTFIRKLDAAVDEKGGDLKGNLVVMKTDLERAKEVLDNLDRAVTNFDRAVTGNMDTIEETLANLRRSAQNAKELTQTLKERPWQILFPESMKDRDVAP